MTLKYSSHGFTIVELMIATAAFSTLLVLIIGSAVQIGNMYQRGVISTRTQEATRNIMESISKDIQFSHSTPVVVPGLVAAVCIGDVRYTFQLNKEVGVTAPHALWRDQIGIPCAAADLSKTDPTSMSGAANGVAGTGKELVPASMRLLDLKVDNSAIPTLWKIDVSTFYGDDVVYNSVTHGCYGINQGGTFCSLSQLHTEVYERY